MITLAELEAQPVLTGGLPAMRRYRVAVRIRSDLCYLVAVALTRRGLCARLGILKVTYITFRL